MIHVTILIEDTTIVAEYDVPTGIEGWTGTGNLWTGKCIDNLTGKCEKIKWTSEQMSAVLALGLGSVAEDSVPGYDTELLYSVAEAAIAGWQKEVRPIP